MLKYACLVLDHDDTVVQTEKAIGYPYFRDYLAQIRPGTKLSFSEYVEKCNNMVFADMCRQHWQFTDEKNPIDLSTAGDSTSCTNIELPFPHNSSKLSYDAASGTYLYSEYGRAHIDPENDNKQLSFTNVIIQCAECVELDGNGYMQFNIMNRSGKGYYITGGHAVPITWEKGDALDITNYYDASGNEITLNTGKTYIGFVATYRWEELIMN